MSRNLGRLFAVAALAVSACAQTSSQFTSLPLSSAATYSRAFSMNEQHLQATPSGALCANSAFAHGYRHGYDQGFHVGDLDVHMGREATIVIKAREYQQGGREYNNAFGSKQLFQEGYQAGFRGGYIDAITGLEYRVSDRTRIAASGMVDVLPPGRRIYFDQGFAGGYRSALAHNAPTENVNAEYVEQYCQKTASGSHPLEYCSGFSRGYMLGMFNAPPTAAKVASSQTAGH